MQPLCTPVADEPVILTPPVVGWLCYQGFAAGIYDVGFLCALFVLFTTVLTFVLTSLTIAALISSEAERARLILSETAARINEESALQAASLKSAFLAMMSHEIRTPMNSVLGYASLLKHTLLDKEQTEYVSAINHSGGILLRVVDDVLDHCCLETGKLQIVAAEYSPARTLDAIGDQFLRAANDKGLELIIRIPDDIPATVLGDEKRLRQVLSNLVGNAIKFTSSGTIIAGVRQRPVSGTSGKIELTFGVEDTGTGIGGEDMEKLFKPFSQVGSGTHQRVSSSGLGLAISKQLVGLMGGEITVSSRIREGSSFRFSIIVDAAAGSVPPEEVAAPAPEGITAIRGDRPLEVLVAEDDRITQMLMKRFFTKFGCNAQFADNGKEAVRLASEHSWDVIFMDVNMPVTDGLEASRLIRAAETAKATPAGRVKIIGLTANVFQDQGPGFTSSGMDSCILKPINYEKFRKLIESLSPKAI